VVINPYPYPFNSYTLNPYSLNCYHSNLPFTPVLRSFDTTKYVLRSFDTTKYVLRSFDTTKYVDINQWFISPKEVLLAQGKGFSLFALCLSISVDRQERTMTPQSTFLLGTFIQIHYIYVYNVLQNSALFFYNAKHPDHIWLYIKYNYLGMNDYTLKVHI
jgi:hypothetical protein